MIRNLIQEGLSAGSLAARFGTFSRGRRDMDADLMSPRPLHARGALLGVLDSTTVGVPRG